MFMAWQMVGDAASDGRSWGLAADAVQQVLRVIAGIGPTDAGRRRSRIDFGSAVTSSVPSST